MATTRRDPAAMDDAKAILNRVRQLVRALRAFDKQAQTRFGLGAAQMFILHVLQHHDELSMNELADRTATDQSSASLAVGKLVAERYVRRDVREEDRRQVRLCLTARGRALVKRSPPAAQERIMDSVEAMSAGERAQLMALLDKLMAGMTAGDERPPMLFQDEHEPAKRRTLPRRPKSRP
ncbi:MAG TPA: MarR family winged helix-turn-helix transcriptional regulator [Thermoanaerobaculia bacterium]|nr:MarR family winged helix-turn-helix transcriptional regulator [Thermoanaerobaculia bacterium]